MKKTFIQKVVVYTGWVIGGFIFLGGVLDAILNAINIINLKLAIYTSSVLLITGLIVLILLKFKKIKWYDSKSNLLTITKLGPRITLSILGGLLLIWFSVYLKYYKTENTYIESKYFKSAFSPHQNRFNILVLPFNKDCEYQGIRLDIGKVITRRLMELNHKDSLNIGIHYLDDSTSLNELNSEEVYKLMKKHHADQIIYGYYSLAECEGTGLTKVCFNYQTDSNVIRLKEKISQTNFQTVNIKGLEVLRKGFGQEDIDYLIYFFAGGTAILSNQYKKGIKFLTKIKNYEKDTTIAQAVALAYYHLGDYASSINIYKKILHSYPNWYLAYSGLSSNYSMLKHWDNSVHYGELSVYHNPNYDIAWGNLGVTYSNLNNDTRAKECFLKAFTLNPKNAIHNMNLGDYYRHSKDYNKAIPFLINAFEIDSLNYKITFLLGLTYAEKNELNLAENYFRKTIRINPGDMLSLKCLGQLYIEKKKFRIAKYYLNEALTCDSLFYQTWELLGKTYLNTHDFSIAKEFYLKANRLQPNNASILTNLAICSLNLHEYNLVIKYSKAVMKIDTNAESAYYNLAAVYSLKNNTDLSLNYLKKAIELKTDLKHFARRDPAFKLVWNNKYFLQITS